MGRVDAPARRRHRLIAAGGLAVVLIAGFAVAINEFAGMDCPPLAADAEFSTGSWTSAGLPPLLHNGRSEFASAAGCDGRIYIVGGYAANHPDATYGPNIHVESSVVVFSPSANAWSDIPPLPTPRVGLAAATGHDGVIYAIGGGHQEPSFPASTVVEAYDPDSGSWTALPPLPTPQKGIQAVTGHDGQIYVISANALLVFDPQRESWSSGTPVPTTRTQFMAAVGSDGRIYVLGGDAGPLGRESNIVESYDPATDTWRDEPPMPLGRASGAAVATISGRILVTGGDSDKRESTVYYDPDSKAWTEGAALPVGRAEHGATVAGDGRVYIVGGVALPYTANPYYIGEVWKFTE